MGRNVLGSIVAAIVISCGGCKMCQTHYDYCASSVDDCGQPKGGFMTRHGSVLGGMPGVPMYQQEPTLADASETPRAATKVAKAKRKKSTKGEVQQASAELPIEELDESETPRAPKKVSKVKQKKATKTKVQQVSAGPLADEPTDESEQEEEPETVDEE